MILPRTESEVIFYNDTNDEALQKILKNWLARNASEFNGAQLYQSSRQLPNEFDVSLRRQRICDMKNISKELIADSTFAFCLEDDTIAPPNSFSKLLQHISSDDDVVVASGIEVGRWSLPVIGAWEIEPLHEPTTIRSVPYRANGTQFVDGVGWYCYITYTNLYKQAHYHYEAEALGPDVVYAWEQRKAGQKVLIDWSLPCAHILESGYALSPAEGGTTEGIWHRDDANNWTIENRPVVLNNGVRI